MKDPCYIIGVDVYEKAPSTYSLLRRSGNSIEVVFTKTAQGGEAFEEEVLNLRKYFNAYLVTEKPEKSIDVINEEININYTYFRKVMENHFDCNFNDIQYVVKKEENITTTILKCLREAYNHGKNSK